MEESAARAWETNTAPAGVRLTPRGERMNSACPTIRSISITARDTAGWVMFMLRVACRMLPCSATVDRIWS